MEDYEFSKYMNQLIVIFRVESISDEDIKTLLNQYSKYFIHMDPLLFGKAIDLLIETHPQKTMPTPREINAAIAEIKKDMPREQHYGEECPKCLSMGMWIDKTDGLAKACDCKAGQTRRANLTAYDTAHPQFKRNREFIERSRRFMDDLGRLKQVQKEIAKGEINE